MVSFRFDFVKVIGGSINPVNLPKGTDQNARTLLAIAKQGPLYVRAKFNIVSILQPHFWCKNVYTYQ